MMSMLRPRRCTHRLTGLMSAERVHRVLATAPCALPLDPDERSRLVEGKLQTGRPASLAEIVRDLTWHQRKGRANARDMQILRQAISALSVWLAAYKGIERARARKRILGAVERKIALFTDEMRDKTRST